MKSILLHIDHDQAMQARLQVALDIARATNGHITCLQAVSYEVFAPGDFYGSAIAAAMPVIKENADNLRAKIEKELEHEGVPFDWRFVYGIAPHRLLEASPLADIVLVGPVEAGSDGQGPSALVGDLVLKSPVPVLVVPKDVRSFDIGAPILVAWNGSSEAAHALRAAVPLLACACKVTLASIAESSDKARFDFPSSEGARYLSRHGIECEIVEIPRGEASIADTLFSAAQVRDCGLMVMGAYGHSRLAELLLGGVTRRMLSDPQMPILLAH
ncbi:universal stress protein [Porphyrobacter sp. ULC335]|uniref:universal stress protein n=1 Tax=Porphyrobacter sp. ULC335 TaxID=2854260 RepID=UPI0022206C8B|nr:universal stress protein [Porphyrobacter sp. ULC335]UYV14284.1 universal stress protein [Porphyrobacter sp. ULC335]